MKHWTCLVLSFLLLRLASSGSADALEVRIHPAGSVYLYEAEPARNLYTVVVQQIALLNPDSSACEIDTLELQALHAGKPVATITVETEDIEASVKKVAALAQQGVLKLYDFHFQTSRYLPPDVKFASSRNLEPGNALIVFSRAMLVSGNTDEITVLARGHNAAGQPVQASAVLKAVKHKSPNDYHFPVSGTWYVGAAPSLHSHHRWVANQEFALDLGMLGPDSRTHSGTGSKLTEYFGYGKDVLAIGDGEVVATGNDSLESNSNLRQPGEASEAYDQRIIALQQELLAKSYLAPLGNYVVIRHEGNEYSHYAHLQAGSVRVKAGDRVKRGQGIGKLGHSGNSTEPHLHFQVTDGADPMYSRGIPVVFSNIEVTMLGFENRPLQTGWIVKTKP